MSSTTMFFLMALVFLGGLGVYYVMTQSGGPAASAPSYAPDRQYQQYPGDAPQARRSFEERDASGLRPFRRTFRNTVSQLEQAGIPRDVARIGLIVALLIAGYVLALIVVKILAGIFTGTATIVGQLIKIAIVPLWQLVLAAISLGDSYEWFGGQFGQNAAIAFVGLSLVMMFFLSRASTASSRT